MLENFQINSKQIDKIKKISLEEKDFRIKNLEFFQNTGFPNKKQEDWKFSDFQNIINNNFDKLEVEKTSSSINKINKLKDFEHNYILLVNGNFKSSNFDYEEKDKIKVRTYKSGINYQPSKNPLVCLNHALAENGYSLEVEKNYKFKKVLVIYNFFTKDIQNKILNNKSNGFFHKYLKGNLSFNSDYSCFIFSSGLKFNKLDLEIDLLNEKCNCKILSALFLTQKEHHEIKTRVNHLAPNCKSYQKVKNVLNSESKGVFQGKIHVKDIAQKTDAYQLSKALLLSDNAEFNSKPELEIYADDVKCSHGSTSGSVDEDSLHYLMTRGLTRKESMKLLVKGFLSDIVEYIKNPSIKKFVEKKIEEQIHEY